jgi:hypothetical protein
MAATLGFAADAYWLPRYKSGAVVAHQGDTDWADFFPLLRKTYYPCSDRAIQDNALEWKGITRCWQSKPGSQIDVALVGDSHAEHLFLGFAKALPEKNVVYYILDGLPIRSVNGMDRIIDHVASDPKIETVIVTAMWGKRGVPKNELVNTLETFRSRGKAVFVTDDVPRFPFEAVACKYRRAPILPFAQCSEKRELFDKAHATYYPELEAATEKVPGVQLLNTAEYFCDNSVCSMNNGDALLYRDYNHLNNVGSSLVANRAIADSPQLGAAITRP